MRRACLAAGTLSLLTGCVQYYDYGPYVDHMPRSVVVLPPVNASQEVEATWSFLATVTQPLAERGYYVFPVAVVAAMMQENGLPTAGEMHGVPPAKLREIFGADAVLYMEILDWGTSYIVIDSQTHVEVEYRLVDLHTGTEIWRQQRAHSDSAWEGAQDPISPLIVSLVKQIATSAYDESYPMARNLNGSLFGDPYHGLLPGPRHPNHEQHLEAARARVAEQAPPGTDGP